MNKKAFLPLTILLCAGVFFSCQLIANRSATDDGSDLNIDPISVNETSNPTKHQLILNTINQVISRGHFSPKPLNDEFSKELYKNYIETVDYGKSYFTQNEINTFLTHQTTIDDEIKQGSLDFQTLVSSTFKNRLVICENFYKEAIGSKFTFDGNETINLDGKKLSWCANDIELKQRWNNAIKFRVLAKYTELKETQKDKISKKDKTLTKVKTDTELLDEAVASVKKNTDLTFKKLNLQTENDRFVNFVNVFAHTIDPHTDFFPPKEKQSFDDQMSGTFFGIGAVLKANEEGNCTIQEIMPGSPSAKEGRLKVGDVIHKVAQGDEEGVDILGWETNDVVKIIRGKKGTVVTLTVKHANGIMENIKIVREKITMEETFAKSAIINQGGNKIGFIYLPEFYADFGNADGRYCAKDMAIEIEKLKKDNVQGIVIDLRNNGGGSLQDVVEIGGQFIDKGPIVQVKSKEEPARPMYDSESGTLYSGPLVILTNNLSASASEILAAAMQDYKRAIVVGNTTFGKGTVQRNIDLDRFLQGADSIKPMGALKLTLQKFYRINGGSTQLKGVTPDIIIPDQYEPYDISERKESNPLPWDEVAKADYQYYNTGIDFSKLIAASQARIQSNQTFNLIKESNTQIKKQKEDNIVPLNEKAYEAKLNADKVLSKKIEALNKEKKVIDNIINTSADKASLAKADTVKQKRNDTWVKAIQKDIYIAEATFIIKDWIKMLPAKSTSVGKN